MRFKTAFALAVARVLRNRNLNRIEAAGIENKSLFVSYVKNNGDVINRKVDPYETKPHRKTGRMMVYLTDDKDGPSQIKSYIADRIRSASKPQEEFEPHWPVKYEGSEE